jgi:DNA polymerase-3 subunit epsilon
VQALRNRRGPYERFDDLVCDVEELHRRQVVWARESAASYQEWLRSPKAGEKQDLAAVIDGMWPLRPVPAGVTA